MEIALLFVLLPGILAYGINQSLCGSKHSPISEIIVSLALQSTCVVILYTFVAFIPCLEVPNIIHLSTVFFDFKNQTNANELKELVATEGPVLMRAFIFTIFAAIIVGLLSAIEKDLRLLRRFGKYFHLFQSTDMDSAWKDLVEMASPSCWAQFQTKDERHLSGPVAVISREYKDGGIGLKNVHLLNPETAAFQKIADYLFISSSEINGPVFFTEPNKTNSNAIKDTTNAKPEAAT